jgi:hypothetical protein
MTIAKHTIDLGSPGVSLHFMTSLGFIEVATLLCHSVVEVLKRDVQIPTNFSKQFFKFKFSGNAQLACLLSVLNP